MFLATYISEVEPMIIMVGRQIGMTYAVAESMHLNPQTQNRERITGIGYDFGKLKASPGDTSLQKGNAS